MATKNTTVLIEELSSLPNCVTDSTNNTARPNFRSENSELGTQYVADALMLTITIKAGSTTTRMHLPQIKYVRKTCDYVQTQVNNDRHERNVQSGCPLVR